jgi:molybdate transport system substrate-binding protein
MSQKILILFVFISAVTYSASSAGSTELVVAAAANVQFTLDDLKAQFTRETGIGVKTVIGSSGSLTSQIENGAPFDVFLSADMKYPAKLYQDGFSSEAPKVYAYGVLVLWTMKNVNLLNIAILSDPGIQKIAVADPRLAPYGLQAVNALKFYKLYGPLNKKLVFGESISQVNQFITTGSADLGFTAKSVVLAPNMKNKGRWIEIEPRSYEPIAQGVIVLKYSQTDHSKEAREFYDFLFSAPARKIFKKYGYNLS